MKDTFLSGPAISGQNALGKSDMNRHSRSLVEDVVDRVTRQISSGELVPGEKLPTEQQMMRSLGVSRTVVREAISRLQAAELVGTRHGIGTFVLDGPQKTAAFNAASAIITLSDVLNMMDFRICLETQAAGLAAATRTSEDIAAFGRIQDEFAKRVRGGEEAVEADVDFHLHVCKATGNRYFEDVYRFIGQNTIPRTRIKIAQYTDEPREQYLMRSHQEHQAVLDAIVRRDHESAQAAMRLHLVNSRERLRKVLEREGQGSGGR